MCRRLYHLYKSMYLRILYLFIAFFFNRNPYNLVIANRYYKIRCIDIFSNQLLSINCLIVDTRPYTSTFFINSGYIRIYLLSYKSQL